MKEEALKLNLLKVFLIYSLLGLILSLGLILILMRMDPISPPAFWVLYYVVPGNGLVGVVRERIQNDLRFSKQGLRTRDGKIIKWEDLQLTIQYSSKLFGKSYLLESKTSKLQDQLALNWWNEEELLRLINTYTPSKHLLRKVMDEHEFGLSSQVSMSAKICVNGFWRDISFDYIFLMLLCGGMIATKYF